MSSLTVTSSARCRGYRHRGRRVRGPPRAPCVAVVSAYLLILTMMPLAGARRTLKRVAPSLITGLTGKLTFQRRPADCTPGATKASAIAINRRAAILLRDSPWGMEIWREGYHRVAPR